MRGGRMVIAAATCVALAYGASVRAAASSPSTFRVVSGGSLAAVTCATTSRCIAVGTGVRTTRVSSDGGNSWTKATTPIYGIPNAVACPTSSVCIAVGRPFTSAVGAIWRSTDAGSSWSSITVPAVAPLNSVTCSSSTRCITASLVSTNAGATWSSHSSPVVRVACDRTGSAHCVGASSSGAVYYSTNAGGTWALSTVPAGAAATGGGACPNSTSCFLVAVASGASGVLRSTNGGRTFSFVELYYLEQGDTWSLTNVACQTALRCLVLGIANNSGEVADPIPVAFTTDDAWSTSTPFTGSPFDNGWATCTAVRCLAASSMLQTVDNFDSDPWVVRLQLVSSGAGTGVACKDTTHCIQVGAFGTAYSTDGGQTWRQTTYAPVSAYTVVGPWCATALQCFEIRSGPDFYTVIDKTTDGGASWNYDASIDDLNAVTATIGCPTSTHCIELSPNGELDWTPTNGWTASTASNPPAATEITCGASSRCYAIAGNGLFVTVDQGTSWSSLGSPGLSNVECIDAQHCLGTTTSGIVRTVNGGSSWTLVKSAAMALSCNAAGRCLGKTKSTIIESTDGGVSWFVDTLTGAAAGGNDAVCRGPFCVIVGNVTLRTP